MPRYWTKIVALGLCLFTLAAFADARPDPPATLRPNGARMAALIGAHVSPQALGGQAWQCLLPSVVQPAQTQLATPITAARPRSVAWYSAAPSDARAPPMR
jgi:hypothetical protein